MNNPSHTFCGSAPPPNTHTQLLTSKYKFFQGLASLVFIPNVLRDDYTLFQNGGEIHCSFVSMLIGPCCLILSQIFLRILHIGSRQQGLINNETKEHCIFRHFGIMCIQPYEIFQAVPQSFLLFFLVGGRISHTKVMG